MSDGRTFVQQVESDLAEIKGECLALRIYAAGQEEVFAGLIRSLSPLGKALALAEIEAAAKAMELDPRDVLMDPAITKAMRSIVNAVTLQSQREEAR